MKLPHRRQFLHLAAGAVALPAVSRIARAQGYPTRPVRIVVGFPPGGGSDITARVMGQWLSERVGQPFVIENRPGAGSNIGTEAVVRSPPGRLYASTCRVTTCDKRNTVRQAELQFPSRHRTGRRHPPFSLCHGNKLGGSSQHGPRVYSLCQGQSGQDQHGIKRHR